MSPEIDYLPPPDDPVAFESLCLDLWREIWGPESDAQKNGRSGQPQAGVDVFGQDGEKWVGIQCKQKSVLLGMRLMPAELEKEIEKARTFVPSLSQFIVATIGPRDEAVQERARKFTRAGFRVVVWSWQEILGEIRGRKELVARIGPDYWPTIWGALGRRRSAPTRLTHVAEELFGRKEELEALDAAWADPDIRVVTFVAWGGVGKTSLVAKWAAANDLGGADYFDWSFYCQGTREEGSASGEPFVNAALRFLGDEEGEKVATSGLSAWDKGAKLAAFVARRKSLLILDGLEPLQYPPSSPLAGQLKDPGVTALLRGLAQSNPGLCVVTTRESVKDLSAFHGGAAPEWSLERLSTAAGVALLEKLQVKGSKKEVEQLVEQVDGHALTLNLIGTFLVKAHGGDVRKRDRVKLDKADAKIQGGHAFKAIAAYENWLGRGGEEGALQLAILRLLGLFDRPATVSCLDALRKEPPIPGLTDGLVRLDEEDWSLAVSSLTDCGLLSLPPASGEGRGLDAHPLVREYFAKHLREKTPEAWRAAHGRLFEHLRDTTPKFPGTLDGLQPLYQSLGHGCHAGRFQEACIEIYRDRILRGTGKGGFYSTTRLGAFGTGLGAMACFFDSPWCRVTTELAVDLTGLGSQRDSLSTARAGPPD